MNRATVTFTLCLLAGLAARGPLPRAAGAEAWVGRGRGILAARSVESNSWRTVEVADRLPDVCELRSAGVGSRKVQLGENELQLGAGTRLQYDLNRRRIVLHSGRISLSVKEVHDWTIVRDDLAIGVARGSVLQANCLAGSQTRFALLRGSGCTYQTDSGDPKSLPGGSSLVFDGRRKTFQMAPLSDPELQAAEAWTADEGGHQGLGQLLIQDAQAGSMKRLNVARYHVNVVLQPPVALVQIDQSFYNPYGRQEEGTFVFNLPQGASVSRFAMYVTPEQLIEGELIERQRAASIYNSIVSRRRDPAILEQIGDNLFRMRAFPIFAHDTKRILLDYTVPLESTGGVYRFQLPLLSDLKPIWDFRVAGTIRGATNLNSVTCASHPELLLKSDGQGNVTFDLTAQDFRPQRDFVLGFRGSETSRASVRSYRAMPLSARDPSSRPNIRKSDAAQPADPWADREVTYFQATIPPQTFEKLGEPAPPADVLILADTSSGIRSRTALRRAVRTLALNLRDTDRFQVGCVDAGFRPLQEKWVSPRSDEAERALRKFADEFFLGESQIKAGLIEASDRFEESPTPRRRVIVYVGDGIDTASRPLPPADAAPQECLKQAGVTFCAVLIDPADEGRQWLSDLARNSGGMLFDGQRASSLKGLFGWALAGAPALHRVVSLEIDGVPTDDLFYPSVWLPGRPLRITGRTVTPGELVCELTVGTGPTRSRHAWKIVLDDRPDDVFVGRLWAQQKLGQLKQQENANQDPLRRRIVGLSQQWSLLSPYTAFLVLETERDYVTWGIDRRVRRRYWKPAGHLKRIPLPPQWLARIQDTRDGAAGQASLDAALKMARVALDAKQYAIALSALDRVAGSPSAKKSPVFARLHDLALQGVLIQTGTQDGVQVCPAVDLRRLPGQLFSEFQSPLLSPAAPPSSAKDHPLARPLLQEIDLQPGGEIEVPINEWLERLTGIDVNVDRRALEDLGYDSGSLGVSWPRPFGVGRMSVWSYLRHKLRNFELVALEQKDGLLITTQEEAEARLETRVYPLADVLLTDRVARQDKLFLDPFLQRAEIAERRLREKLRRPVSFAYQNLPLEDALKDFAEQFGGNVIVDERSLGDLGVGIDTLITARARNLPASSALRRMLGEINELDFRVADEAVIISTKEELEDTLKIQLHSGRGIVVGSPRPGLPFGSGAAGFSANPMALGGGMAASGLGGMGLGGAGFGGGVGGGMGGGGGGGGGFPGGGGAGTPLRRSSGASALGGAVADAGMSSGGDGEEQPLPDADETARGESDDVSPADAGEQPVPRAATAAGGGDIERRMDSEADEVASDIQYELDWWPIELIRSTIDPTTWTNTGGPSSIEPCEATLDFVVAAPDEIHERIDALLERLRGMPAELDEQTGSRLMDEPPAIRRPGFVDFDGFRDLIMATVFPINWDIAGGACALEFHTPRMAAVISADQETHREVTKLLTYLRRSRYALRNVDRPWEDLDRRGLLNGFGVTRFDSDLTSSELPRPQQAELEALAVRRPLPGGTWKWRCRSLDDRRWLVVTLDKYEDGLQLQDSERRMRSLGDVAAVAYPGLALVEFGPWGEAVRRSADLRLPWLPHRSNAELASLFRVERVDGPSPAEVVVLRLTPAGIDPAAETGLLASYRRADGQPVLLEAYLGGKLTGRLRFQRPPVVSKMSVLETVTLEDADGKRLFEWQLTDSRRKKSVTPALADGWEGYVQLDRRTPEPANAFGLQAVLSAIRRADWPQAHERLHDELEKHPGQPLLRFLRAWVTDQNRHLGSPSDMANDLRAVAESPAVGLTREITPDNFTRLSPAGIYYLLLCQPEATCTADDWQRLARAAFSASRFEQALGHVRRSLQQSRDDEPRFERTLLHVEILLRLDREEEAVRVARQWAGGAAAGSDELSRLAALFERSGRGEDADPLLLQALSDEALPVDRRYDLMRRRAESRRGAERWKLLIEALQLWPASAAPRKRDTVRLFQEMSDAASAELVGDLAKPTRDAALRYQLLMRQAELSTASAESARLIWEIAQAGYLPSHKLAWASRQLTEADQPERAVRVLEGRLRRGVRLSEDDRGQLRMAYLACGRERDAVRAGVQDPVQSAPPTGRPNRRAWMRGGMF